MLGITCAKNCKNKLKFAKVIQGKLGLFFWTRCIYCAASEVADL